MWFYYVIGFVVAYLIVQISFILSQLIFASDMHRLKTPQNKLAGTGKTFEETKETELYSISHTVRDGIELRVHAKVAREGEPGVGW